MAQLIVYINSEQKASAYYNNSYLSFHGARYDANLTDFSEIVQEELDHSFGEKRDEISVLIVSNGATNETVRTVISNLLNTENEEGILNVNVQELNVIEAKYFLPMLGNPETPEAEDFARFFEFKNSYPEKLQELENLTSEVSTLKKTIEEKDSEISELQSFKELVTKKVEEIKEKRKVESELNQKKGILENKNIQDCICKIDFINDTQQNDNNKFFPHTSEKVFFNRKVKNGARVSYGQIIGIYGTPFFSALGIVFGRIVMAKTNGRIYYFANDNALVGNGEIVAVIGDFNSKDEAAMYFKEHNLM